MKRVIHSVLEMYDLASSVARELSGGEILGLEGELGSGKTEFVRGLAEALGSKDRVKSPTFTLLNVYRTTHPSILYLVHVDLYRLHNVSLAEVGLDEWLGRADAVVVIEWPERLQEPLPEMKLFAFTYGSSENEREVTPRH